MNFLSRLKGLTLRLNPFAKAAPIIIATGSLPFDSVKHPEISIAPTNASKQLSSPTESHKTTSESDDFDFQKSPFFTVRWNPGWMRWESPQMSWTCSRDTLLGLTLQFRTPEDASKFATQQGWLIVQHGQVLDENKPMTSLGMPDYGPPAYWIGTRNKPGHWQPWQRPTAMPMRDKVRANRRLYERRTIKAARESK